MRTRRRAFLRGLAAAPLAPAMVAQPPAAAADAPTGRAAVAEAMAEALKREFGDRLDAADLDAARKEIARGLERADRLRRAAGLRNADAPVNLFFARPPVSAGTGGRR